MLVDVIIAAQRIRRMALAGLAALCMLLSVWLPSAGMAQTPDLGGIWQVSGYTRAFGNLDFLVRITRTGENEWEAEKLSSSRYVPTGRTHFRARVEGDMLRATVQVAFPGFAEPEWERHQFSIETDDDGAVRSITLATGEQHFLDETGENSVTDTWTYTPWPEDQLLLSAPRLSWNGYAAERTLARRQLQAAEGDLEHWQSRRESEAEGLERLLRDQAATLGHSAVLAARYEEAWRRLADAATPEGDPPPDRTELPERLRVLYDQQTAAQDEIERLEQILLDHSSGRATQSDDTIADLFSRIDQSRAFIERLSRTISRLRDEMGLGPEPDPAANRDDRVSDAEAAFEEAGDAYFDARREVARLASDIGVAEGQIALAAEEIADAEERAANARARLKFLSQSSSLQKVEIYTSGDEPRLVFEAIPSGLDAELRDLQAILDEILALVERAEDTRERFRAAHADAFYRGTLLRTRLERVIYENAALMAYGAAHVRVGELLLSYATGGPIGVLIDIVTSIIFQFVAYEDGAVFSNFDEADISREFRARIAQNEDAEPDPAEICAGLDLEISQSVQALLRTRTSQNMQAYFDARAAGGGIDPVTGEVTGNTYQRIQPNLLNYFAMAGQSAGNDAVGASIGERIAKSDDLARANAEHSARVVQRAAQWAVYAVDDHRMIDVATTPARRAAAAEARTAALRSYAAQYPELADDIARNIEWTNARLQAFEEALIVREGGAASVEAGVLRAQEIGAEVARAQRELREVIGSSLPQIDFNQTLSQQRVLWQRLSARLETLNAVQRQFARWGLSGRGKSANIKAGALNIIYSVGMGFMLDQLMVSLQEREFDIWMDIFAAEAEQNMMYRGWQAARCIHWAFLDQRDALQRDYALLYDVYDPEAELQVLRSEPFGNHNGLRMDLIFDPPAGFAMQAQIAGVPCAKSARSSCRIPQGGLAVTSTTILPVDVDLGPPD